jgi:hypothetical protein
MLAGFVDPESAFVQRVLGEPQPRSGNFKQQCSVLWGRLLGEPDALIRATGIVYFYSSTHALHRRFGSVFLRECVPRPGRKPFIVKPRILVPAKHV